MTDSPSGTIGGRLAALLSGARLGQFASVGAVGAVVDFAVLVALVEVVGVGELVAKVIAWQAAIVVIFAINERWTFSQFGDTGLRPLGGRFLRSNLVRIGGFVVTMTMYGVLIEVAGVWYVAANAIGIGVGFFVNYACESLYTWKVHRAHR